MPFRAVGGPRRDNPGYATPVGMYDHEDKNILNRSQTNRSFFTVIVSVINLIKGGSLKNSHSRFESNAVLCNVALVFIFVPLKIHAYFNIRTTI